MVKFAAPVVVTLRELGVVPAVRTERGVPATSRTMQRNGNSQGFIEVSGEYSGSGSI